MECPDCGKDSMVEQEREAEFQVGSKRPVMLKATAPVLVCDNCGAMLADWRMERARSLAMSAYFHREERADYVPDPYRTAHVFSGHHRKQLEHAGKAGCFYCLQFFDPSEVTEWIDDDQTALCPGCGIDSVLPVDEQVTPEFLKAMQQSWFAVARTI
jgi:predicted RNA-binding Zn-ribbon protein involved in translation (DUF1610 family)